MNRLVRSVGRVGDLTDAVVAGARLASARIREAWAAPRHRWAGLGAGSALVLLYLLAIGDISLAPGRGGATVEVAADWTGRLTATRAPYLFEPVAAFRPGRP